MNQATVFTKIKIDKSYLLNKKFLYAIVDQDNLRTRHPQLFKKMYDMTYSFSYRMSSTSLAGPVKYFNTVDECMAQSQDYDIVLIQNVGNFIRINQFFELLDNYGTDNPNFFLIAFTLDWEPEKGQGWVEIHNQMIVVNVETWKKLGKPLFGERNQVTEELPNYTRSEENFHDRYTPHWMQGSHGTSLKTRQHAGWGWLTAAFSNGIRIDNFSEQMRKCRLYVYPGHESELFYNALQQNSSTDLTNPNQKKLIDVWFNPKKLIWIFNSEYYKFGIPVAACDTYFGPAAGFKYLDILNSVSTIKFIFYDSSAASIEWLKLLKTTWDGNDLKNFLKRQPLETKKMFKFINEDIDKNIEILHKDFGGEQKFKELWNRFREASAEFVTVDLLNNNQLENLLALGTGATRPLFYYSNIFATDFTSMRFSVEELTNEYNNFQNLIDKVYPRATTYGSDPKGRWIYRRSGKEIVQL